MRAHAPAEIDTGDDITPLVRAAHLQIAAMEPRQFNKIVGLQDHVVKFDKTHLLIAVEP